MLDEDKFMNISRETIKNLLKHFGNLRSSLHELDLHLNFSGLLGNSLDRANVKSNNEMELTFDNGSGKKTVVRIEAVTDENGRSILEIQRNEIFVR